MECHRKATSSGSPCAACKILRRRCGDECVLAPYFPSSGPIKFAVAHKIFGASNIIKFLLELPEYQRWDAVSSMVYEANARVRDPIYGSAGTIYQLQKQVNELQEQLVKSQAEIINLQHHQTHLMKKSHQPFFYNNQEIDTNWYLDETNFINYGLGPLWI